MTAIADDELVWLEKDKDASLSYQFKLEKVIGDGDAIASLAAAVSPAGALSVGQMSWQEREATVVLLGGVADTWYSVVFTWVSQAGLSDQFVVRVRVNADAEALPSLGSALFPNRFTATNQMRRDRLMLAAKTVLKGAAEISDDYLWGKLVAAESEVKHKLRVPLVPTKFFPSEPTSDQLAALPAGMPYEVDPGYDYEPDFFASEAWGHMRLRNKPLQSVEKVEVRFPSTTASYTIPPSWLRMDKKYGDLQFVPDTSGGSSIPLNSFMIQALGLGRNVPFAVQVTYVAGLANVASTYPELLDVVKKMAVLSILDDLWMPQSGSISGDGLSESVSVDMDKYRENVEHALFGPKGRNGGLYAAIHGVRVGFM